MGDYEHLEALADAAEKSGEATAAQYIRGWLRAQEQIAEQAERIAAATEWFHEVEYALVGGNVANESVPPETIAGWLKAGRAALEGTGDKT